MTENKNLWRVATEHGDTTAAVDRPADGSSDTVFVCAHGAGGQMNDRAVVAVSRALCGRGLTVVRFNFLYRERKSARPDPMPQLQRCFEAVVGETRNALHPRALIIGGRSMGGRAASMLAAEGFACDGLLLLAYPLHPPGQLKNLRVQHLPSIQVPVLCLSGTRDPFCDPVLMSQAIHPLGAGWTMRWLDGADHSFNVLKRSGTTNAAVLNEVAEVTQKWVAAL